MFIFITVNVEGPDSLKSRMNLKSVGTLLLFLTLCIEVQKSESAVSVHMLLTSFSYHIMTKRNILKLRICI